jgi:hypothetical protein
MSDKNRDGFNRVAKFLGKHVNKNFVHRIFEPQLYPDIKNKDGSRSTHRMRVDHLLVGDKEVPAMYPTIFWEDGHMIDYGDDVGAAKKHAIDSGEYIPFDNLDDALWMERNWKRLWGMTPRDE